MYTFKFRPSKRKFILYIKCFRRVVSQLFFAMFVKTQLFGVYSQASIPVKPDFFPLIHNFRRLGRMNKILHLHLLKFTGSEYKITGGYFIPESFSYLSYPKWNLFPGGIHNIHKIHINTLGGFRPHKNHARTILNRAHKCFEHQVKIPGTG